MATDGIELGDDVKEGACETDGNELGNFVVDGFVEVCSVGVNEGSLLTDGFIDVLG